MKCTYCETPFIDPELNSTFSLNCCTTCKHKLNFITKTTAIKDYLLSNDDLKKLPFISRPNPHKGNWHDMCLYLLNDIEKLSLDKYQSKDNIEKIKIDRNEKIKERKIQHIKRRIRELKKRTIVLNDDKDKHEHVFVNERGRYVCRECKMEIDREEI